jgi:hypothetical protein
MRILVIISSHKLDKDHSNNIKILKQYLKGLDVDYCGISNENDFHNYEHIIKFKYKIINTKKQMGKMCDFISDHQLDYDYYMKCRPDVRLLQSIDFSKLSNDAIHARARVYCGPREIQYGMSVNGTGIWNDIGDCYYHDIEFNVVLDDMLYIFHNNIIKLGAFNKLKNEDAVQTKWFRSQVTRQNEWFHSHVFNERNINLIVIGINLIFTKNNTYSGDINYIKKSMISNSK